MNSFKEGLHQWFWSALYYTCERCQCTMSQRNKGDTVAVIWTAAKKGRPSYEHRTTNSFIGYLASLFHWCFCFCAWRGIGEQRAESRELWEATNSQNSLGITILVHSPNANSEKRSQTQIKGSAFGFLEDGRELNYNPDLINPKK